MEYYRGRPTRPDRDTHNCFNVLHKNLQKREYKVFQLHSTVYHIESDLSSCFGNFCRNFTKFFSGPALNTAFITGNRTRAMHNNTDWTGAHGFRPKNQATSCQSPYSPILKKFNSQGSADLFNRECAGCQARRLRCQPRRRNRRSFNA